MPCELAHFEAILEDHPRLGQTLGMKITDGWLQFPESMRVGYEYLRANPAALGWWTYLFTHISDNALIGNGGFAGPADVDGMVEIGYSIAPEYRNRGLATEAARGLISFAFASPQIRMVDAHTLSEVNPSTSVLERVGMKRIGTATDPDEGEVWHWRLMREDYD